LDVYVNQRRWGRSTLLAVCDKDLLGKELKHGKVIFRVREEFYKGPLVNLDEAINLVRQSTVVNMVGGGIVKKAVEEGLIHPDAILLIQGVPHAQIVKA
jgi:hypothetical protein